MRFFSKKILVSLILSLALCFPLGYLLPQLDLIPQAQAFVIKPSKTLKKYHVDPTVADQGAATTEGNRSVKDLVDSIGTSKKAALVFEPTGSGNTTTYTFSTSESIPSNIQLVIQNGAILSDGGGSADLTISGEIIASPTQKVFDWTGSGSVAVGNPQVSAIWYTSDGSGTSSDPWTGASGMAGLGEAIASNGAAKVYYCPGGYYEPTSDIMVAGYDDITIKGDGQNKTIFLPTAAVTKVFDVDNSAARKRRIRFEGFKIDGQLRDIDYGFYVRRSSYVDWYDIWVYQLAGSTAGNAIYIEGDATNYNTHLTIGRDVVIQNNAKDWGIEINGQNTTISISAYLQSNGGGIYAGGTTAPTSIIIDRAVIESNDDDPTSSQRYGVYFDGVGQSSISNTFFEMQEYHILLDAASGNNCSGITIGPGNNFANNSADFTGFRTIKLDGDQDTQIISAELIDEIELTSNSDGAYGLVRALPSLTDNSANSMFLVMNTVANEFRLQGNSPVRIYNDIFSVRNQSACRVYRSTTNQSVADNVVAKVEFNAEDYDNQNEFDPSTNYNFIATKPGGYLVSSAIRWDWAIGDGTAYWIMIYVNGSEIARAQYVSGGANAQSAFISMAVNLAAGDTLDIRVAQTSGVAVDIIAGSNHSWCSISKIW